jgi:hypothetical protein
MFCTGYVRQNTIGAAPLGPLESIIGVLMCGLSASFLFADVSKLVDREARGPQTLPSQSWETLLLERRFAAAKPRDAASRPYASVRIVLARGFR